MNIRYIWYKLCKKMQGVAIKNSSIDRDAKIEAGSVFISSKIRRFSYCGYDCFICNTDIGSFCSISDNVSIGGGHHPINWVSTSPAFYKGRDSISKRIATLEYNSDDSKTIIGNDVWIGRGVYIKSGVSIGDGAIIGMGSVVTKNVMPYAIVCGNPARVIRQRFDKNMCDKLSGLEWWNWDEEKLRSMFAYSNNPELFMEYMNV